MYSMTMVYPHEEYLKEIERIQQIKTDFAASVGKQKLPFIIKFKVNRLLRKFCKLKLVLDEEEQRKLVLNEETWSCDSLDYNVNRVYEYINDNNIVQRKIPIDKIIDWCNVVSDKDIHEIEMTDSLRKSKEENPIIILDNEMLIHPIIINGNHRIRLAYTSGIKELDIYVINSNDVTNCLTSDDYRTAYNIYKELHRLIGVYVGC